MGYFSELYEFNSTYRLGTADRIRMLFLYPIFKIHFWFYYGSRIKRWVAASIFRAMPTRHPITIRCHCRDSGSDFSIPIWLAPDHLTSFREIFWCDTYKLNPGWAPKALIDAGANIGYASLYFSARYNVRKILAIEANPHLHSRLEVIATSLRKSGVDIRIGNGALVGRSRFLHLEPQSNSRDSAVSERLANDGSALAISGYQLREWSDRLAYHEDDFGKDTLLKMDIEGSEFEVFAEDRAYLSKFSYLVAEIHGEKAKRDHLAESISPCFDIKYRQTNAACNQVEVLHASLKLGEPEPNSSPTAPQ